MAKLLQERRWIDLFVHERERFPARCEVWLFGHAVLEKLLKPYKAITAHAWPVCAEDSYFNLAQEERKSVIDVLVAKSLDNSFTTQNLMPLPIAGVPGWFEHQDEKFYLDSSVFRPMRQK